MSPRLPMRCLRCGNAMLTDRTEMERLASVIEDSSCNICDVGGEFAEQFYVVNGKALSFGEYMDLVEAKEES